jgi:D-alanyl-D-alanine carboxypeptidase/D-alanyl-D-alanine-endopeptidase (penicillin-binding protein 4)
VWFVYNLKVRANPLTVRGLVAGFVVSVFLQTAPAPATDDTPHAPSIDIASLRAALESASVRSPALPAGTSVAITDLETGGVIFERNADAPQTLASVTKMISSAAALHYLGPQYKYKTNFWRQGEIRDGVLEGGLLVVGSGDPNISGRFYNDDYNAVFDTWADGLKRLGVLRVTGDLVLNASAFDSVGRHPDWPVGQEARWYQAPISALSYNDNVVLVSIAPGRRLGGPVQVSIDPPTGMLRAVSTARTVGRRRRVRLAVSRAAGSNAVTVSGSVPLRRAWWSTPVAIDDPPRFFGAALAARLKNAGIQFEGRIVERPVTPDASWNLVATTESELLSSIVVCNKRSQGFYAEQIFKTLSAEKTGRGNWGDSIALAAQFLASLGLDPSRIQLRDGSGLSPQNRASANELVHFLGAMSRHPYGDVWRSTLAFSGDPDGTLRHRFREASLSRRVAAKTGSIKAVSTLAGYATANSGRTYAFAILLNGRGVWDSRGHAYQDRLIRTLILNG